MLAMNMDTPATVSWKAFVVVVVVVVVVALQPLTTFCIDDLVGGTSVNCDWTKVLMRMMQQRKQSGPGPYHVRDQP